MLLPGLLLSPVNIVGGGQEANIPRSWQLISRGCGKCQSLPVTVCAWILKPCRSEAAWSICLLGRGLLVRVEMRCAGRWIPIALPSSYSWMPSKVPHCYRAVRATQKQWKQGTIGITGIARLHASLTSQNTFPYPCFPMGRLRHREIFASSTSSQRPRNNDNIFFFKKGLFKLSAICADFQCNFPI